MATRTRTPGAKPATAQIQDADKDDEQDDLPEVVNGDEQIQLDGVDSGGKDVVEETVDQLRERLATETRRADEAERRAANTTVHARSSINQSSKAAIENAISNEQTQISSLQAEIIAAKEGGDYAKEVELTTKLQQANIRAHQLNMGKNEIDRRIEDETQQASVDPVEEYVKGMKPEAASWIRAHPAYVTDPALQAKLQKAHMHAVGEDLDMGSQAYFDHIETRLGLKQAPQRQPDDGQQQQGARPPAAPPSRSNDPGYTQSNARLPEGVTQLGDGKYRLSPARREAAQMSGLTDAEYLKNLLDLQREGALH